ncbi:MAG: hypothetical protein Q3974_01250 [Rothia sp. (in: high G+C Gram-positive bacteria)]|nr:hypothetical protein [Rothia sp. (in: high G+C Gram-positive bacteria)]
MSYNDNMLERYDAFMDHEFEREMLYRSMAISYTWSIWMFYVTLGVLIWVLPGVYSLFAMLPFFSFLTAMAIDDVWYSPAAPSHRQHRLGYPPITSSL